MPARKLLHSRGVRGRGSSARGLALATSTDRTSAFLTVWVNEREYDACFDKQAVGEIVKWLTDWLVDPANDS